MTLHCEQLTALTSWKRRINTHCYLTSKQSFCVTYSYQYEAPADTEDSSVRCGNGKWFKYFFFEQQNQILFHPETHNFDTGSSQICMIFALIYCRHKSIGKSV